MQIAAEAILSLLCPVLSGVPLEEAIRSECTRQRNPHFGFPFFKWLAKEDFEVVGRNLSTACYIEAAVPTVIYLALKYAADPEQALLTNTNLGADNVHLGAVLGGLLGAQQGAAGWPQRWARWNPGNSIDSAHARFLEQPRPPNDLGTSSHRSGK